MAVLSCGTPPAGSSGRPACRLLAYYAGKAAGDAVGRYGLYGAVVVIAAGVIAIVALRVWHKRALESS